MRGFILKYSLGMNDTIVSIPGIRVSQGHIDLQDSTDRCTTLTLKDVDGKVVRIVVQFGKIIDVCVK